jgi:hypothetical protein
MTTSGLQAGGHPGAELLLDYWFGDTDDGATAAVAEHLLRCDACGAEVDRLAALAYGVREAFAEGRVGAVVGLGFVDRLTAKGLRIRRYHVAHNGSVACSVAPEDEVLVGVMQAPLEGVQRLDLAADFSFGGDTVWLRDVPFDAEAGAVVLLPQLATVRTLPTHEMRVRLWAVQGEQAHEIGHYTFRHSADRPATAL